MSDDLVEDLGRVSLNDTNPSDDEEEVAGVPLLREPSTPSIERVLKELRLLNLEDKKEVFYGLHYILSEEGVVFNIKEKNPKCPVCLKTSLIGHRVELRLCAKCEKKEMKDSK